MVCLDGATLIESGITCHYLVGILADKMLRRKRIMARDSLSEESAKRRIDAQHEDEFFIEKCDFVVYNNEDGFDVEDLVKRMINEA